MKSVSFIFSSNKKFEEFITANKLTSEKEYLIRIHTCIHNYQTVMPFVNNILAYFPHARIIGSSTTGVIYEGQILTDCCLVSITECENMSVKTCLTPLSSNGVNVSGNDITDLIAGTVVEESTKFMLAFAARPFDKIEELVERMNRIAPQVSMIGGIAIIPRTYNTLSFYKNESFVFTEYGSSRNSVACAAINSKTISSYNNIIYVTEPIGTIHTITDAEGPIIRKIDDENAVQWYQKMLGIDFSKMSQSEIESMNTVFPLVKTDHGNSPWAIFYSPQNEENSVFANETEPVLYVANEAKPGDKIRISYSSLQKTIDTCENVCEDISAHPCEVLFGYSCFSRQNMFKNCAKWELLPFARTNLSGALVAGEIGNIEGSNRYCNYSFAIASLSEKNVCVRLDIYALTENAGELVNNQENIIEYLLKNHNTDENQIISEQNREIENNLFIDNETGLENVTKFSFDHNLGKFDKLCMITIRNESLIKAFLSEYKFLYYFNRYHKYIMSCLSDGRYNCYLYKQSVLLITGSPEISDDEFAASMAELQNVITDFKFFSYVPVCEFSIVMHENDLIQKAELTLLRMKNKNYTYLVYTADLGLEQFNAHKMKMIMLLNDAISNDRIVPYFQGIRDNLLGEIKMYESLMRIEDADRNVYTPYYFMDIAKEYGYYADISYIMINKVMKMFSGSSYSVTINMTVSDVYNYKIVHSILRFLEKTPYPQNFIFELTETEEVTDYQVIFEFVEKVHNAGGAIAIDDFGSGFSNIVNIFKIQSDYIKIDGEIIKNIRQDIFAREFLEMISGWAQKHNKEIIAEFVESADIQEIIEENNIRYSQGYLYSKPRKIIEIPSK